MSDPRPLLIVEFAELCGVSKQAVSKAVQKGRLPIGEDGKIDPSHPDCVAYREKHKTVAAPPLLEHTTLDERDQFLAGASSPSPPPPQSSGGRGISRRDLELRKLEQQGDNLELKNKQLRGVLANVKFYDELFHTQLAFAVKTFKTLPDAIVDDLIALAMDRGTDARAEIMTEMTSSINEILADTKEGWVRAFDRVEEDLLEIIGDG
jgi:hypothetical protein